ALREKAVSRAARAARTRPTRRPAAAAGVALVVLAAVASCTPPAGPLENGVEIAPFQLEQLRGGELGSQDLRGGEPVVINFWATWCVPCVREIPALSQIHRQRAARVVSINLDREGPPVVQPFVDEHHIDYPVLLGDLDVIARYGGSAIPYTLVLDGDLKLVQSFRGLVSHHSLERAIAKARAS
ncbi:MAG: TlpA disulfide reductase family protein, partial [Acidobacteriota bacterium]